MKVDLVFPTVIYVEDFGSLEFNQYLEKNILEWQKKDKGMLKTNVNGWHSKDDMHLKEEYKPLVQDLYKAQKIIYEKEKYELEPILGNMWANINYSGGYNKPHVHPNSLWSGVYYIKTPENCGDLVIDDPKLLSKTIAPRRQEPGPKHALGEIRYKPIAGRLIMFPSYLNHCVELNKSDDIRISVSFNFLQKGMYL
tara:strand:+ start:1823 stop:2410 length:588 start_codon:yes stop_codon:yes gene_type:complete